MGGRGEVGFTGVIINDGPSQLTTHPRSLTRSLNSLDPRRVKLNADVNSFWGHGFIMLLFSSSRRIAAATNPWCAGEIFSDDDQQQPLGGGGFRQTVFTNYQRSRSFSSFPYPDTFIRTEQESIVNLGTIETRHVPSADPRISVNRFSFYETSPPRRLPSIHRSKENSAVVFSLRVIIIKIKLDPLPYINKTFKNHKNLRMNISPFSRTYETNIRKYCYCTIRYSIFVHNVRFKLVENTANHSVKTTLII